MRPERQVDVFDGHLTDAPGRDETWTETVTARADGTWTVSVSGTSFDGTDEAEPDGKDFATAEKMVDFLHARDEYDTPPRRRIGPRLERLAEFAAEHGYDDVLRFIDEIRHPARPRAPTVRKVLRVVSIGSWPNGRSRKDYLSVETDRGPGVMSMPADGGQWLTVWPGDHPYTPYRWRVRLTRALRDEIAAASERRVCDDRLASAPAF